MAEPVWCRICQRNIAYGHFAVMRATMLALHYEKAHQSIGAKP